jgi:hypothetical protein
MGRFYSLEKGEINLLKADTLPQARKLGAETILPSVTTKLSYAPDFGIRQWREKELIKLGREHPEMDYADIDQLAWGMREAPDGSMVSSSDFGLKVHAAIEGACQGVECPPEWSKWVSPFMQWLKVENVEVLHCEHMVACEARKLAGTIDGIGRKDNEVILWDFKTRAVNGGDIKEKAYPKDAMQLAVEAQIIREQWGLSALPRIYTVIVSAEDGTTFCKLWTEKAQAKAYGQFMAVNQFYNDWENLA